MSTNSKFYKSIFFVALATAILLMIPLVGMQFSDEVKWSLSDFIVAGFLLFGTGFTYLLLMRKSADVTYRVGVAIGLATGLFLIWSNLAVGLIGSEDNPINIVYFRVIAIGIIGAVMSRFQPRGMALTMFAIVIALVLIAVSVLIYAGIHDADFTMSKIMRYLGIHGFFITFFAISGLLFRQAAQEQTKANAASKK